MVHRFASHEEAHDLAGALEDQVDARVPQVALQGCRILAAGAQRIGGLVSTASPDLHRVVHQVPALLAVPELGHGRFQSYVQLSLPGHGSGEFDDRFHRKRLGRHPAHLLRHRVVLADRGSPLHPLRSPLARRAQESLRSGGAESGKREASGVERDQGELQALPLAPQEVLPGHPDIGEAKHAVRDAVQAHEATDLGDLHTLPVGLDNKGADRAGALHSRAGRGPRHHHEQLGPGPVRRPQLFAVQDIVLTVFREFGEGGHVCRIGPDHRLGEGECRQLTAGGARQILALLLLGAEEHQGRRDADGLVRREESGRRGASTRHEAEGAIVGCLREAEATVLARDLDSVRTQRGESLQHRIRHPAFAVEGVPVHMLDDESLEAFQKGGGPGRVVGILLRMRVDQVERKPPAEQLLHEAALVPPGLARAFRDLARLPRVADALLGVG